MLTNSKTALSLALALALAAALATTAALNRPAPPDNTAIQQQFPAGAQ
jgi:hypothetical protein